MIFTLKLKAKFFRDTDHPYHIFQKKIASVLHDTDTLLDAGCGRSAPILRKFTNRAGELIGIDLEDYPESLSNIHLIKGNLSYIPLKDNSVDIVISRSVLEHIKNPISVYNEINRILRPAGSFIFLTPNLMDYVSIISWIIPNKFHNWIMSKIEGRNMQDSFPTYYKANTYHAIKKLSKKSGFLIAEFKYLGQYPSTFTFNSLLFLLATAYEKIISKFDCFKFLRGWLLVQLIKK